MEFIFPGQGSQVVGMGKLFFDNFSIVRQTFEEAADALSFDIRKLCFDGPESDLSLTANAQPALVCVSTALARVIKSYTPIVPRFAAGHSLGEYSAMVASDVLSFSDALKVVRIRGQVMQETVPVGIGSMVAILGLTNEEVTKLCKWTEEASGFAPLEPANFNAPGQVIASGSAKAIEWLKSNFSAEKSGIEGKVKFSQLKVSAPFHCSMMMPAQIKMSSVLSGIQFGKSKFPIIQNVTATETIEAEELRSNLVLQISSPVLWSQSIQRMGLLGGQKFLEVGPGKVLAALLKRNDPDLKTYSFNTLEDLKILEQEYRI